MASTSPRVFSANGNPTGSQRLLLARSRCATLPVMRHGEWIVLIALTVGACREREPSAGGACSYSNRPARCRVEKVEPGSGGLTATYVVDDGKRDHDRWEEREVAVSCGGYPCGAVGDQLVHSRPVACVIAVRGSGTCVPMAIVSVEVPPFNPPPLPPTPPPTPLRAEPHRRRESIPSRLDKLHFDPLADPPVPAPTF